MYVDRMMTREVIKVTPDTKVTHMSGIMRDRHVRHLPVVDEHDHLVGLVSQRDLQRVAPSPISTLSAGEVNYLLNKVTAEKIMHREVVTCSPDTPVEQAACIMRDRSVGCLPVVAEGRLLGILTGVDLIDFFLNVSGCRAIDTARIAVHLRDESSELSTLLAKFVELGAHITSLLSPMEPDDSGMRISVIRYRAADPVSVHRQLVDAGYDVVSANFPES
jgi:acetoin utilization protein AcuB